MATRVCSNRARNGLIAFMMAAAQVQSDSNLNYAFGGSGWGVPGNPDYVPGSATCASGMKQSPVHIETGLVSKVGMSPLNMTYEDSKSWTMFATFNYLEVEEIDTISSDNIATSSARNGITMDTYGYTMSGESAAGLYVPLNQFHFHSPSENMLDGMHFPLEMHMVHKRFSNPQFANGTLTVATVVAIMFKLDPTGATNLFVDQILNGPLSPEQSNGFFSNASQQFEETDAKDQFSLMEEVFKFTGTSKYYAFTGSLTTPPCSEGINWRVLATPLTISGSQLQGFKNALSARQRGFSRGGDNRDVQSLSGRTVMASFDKDSSKANIADSAYSAGPVGLLHLAVAVLLFMSGLSSALV